MKKIKLLLKVAVAFLFAFLLSFNLMVKGAMATGEFSRTCEDIELKGSTLIANCDTSYGDDVDSSLNLDEFIGNLDGTLSWGDHNFSQTCRAVGLGQLLSTKAYILSAECERADQQSYISTDIVLDEHIANIEGTLTYE
ncbi:CVNH domain-containing protein [Gloeothece verrucosa]|uniref:Cyanovirin-N domain protein n=1 Tax=Gloeothece verrucosa (strain PCC 7822) TaxID=497965 RepID=E0UFQ8_GLOV7|nr:CVNH domain-containing protein [Gloeothece verrucosa]ADN13169.1 Cyanovirin-N domain protein [Gloeothece verrucosa PCC 7822]